MEGGEGVVDSNKISFWRKLFFSFIGFFGTLILLLLLGEVVMRVCYKASSPPYNNHQIDSLLGWKTVENYTHFEKKMIDKRGDRYDLSLTFTKHGFRKWNDFVADTPCKTFFFLGDSYTESMETSDENLFYNHLRDSLLLNVYAYGTAGYGTIQELLILQMFIDSIRPNVIILEMCNNDFVDNYWEVEKRNCYTAGQIRPYLNCDNQIEYHYPLPWYKAVKEYSLFGGFLVQHLITSFVNLKLINGYELTVEDMVADNGYLKQLISESFNRTECAMNQIKKVADRYNAHLIVFDADHYPSGANWLPVVCKRNCIDYIAGVGEWLFENELRGESVRSLDGYHWNQNGHRIVSDTLLHYIRNNKL